VDGRRYNFCIFSTGSDGRRDEEWHLGSIQQREYARDLVICDGQRIAWPIWPGAGLSERRK
jgi:hypothetical protein